MIEVAATEHFGGTTFRYMLQERASEMLREMGLDTAGVDEVLAASNTTVDNAALVALLDSAFITKAGLPPEKTRFSDGTIRVLYSALEQQTAAHEAFDWYIKDAVSGARSKRVVFYMLASLDFAGAVKDLRPHHAAMPFLTQRDDPSMSKCNEIGLEAVGSNLDGLLSPSAAIKPGTCLPVFQRRALTNLNYLRLEKFTLDPAVGVLSVDPA